MYILDTNVVSELRRPRPSPQVVEWVSAQANEDLHLASVTIGELQAGVERLRKRDAERAATLDIWIDDLVASHAVIPIDASIYRSWARLMVDRPESLCEDALIAATARARGFTVVTRSLRDFKSFEVKLLDPFATPR
ncbi:MAG: type II toxin-antitoxin system VapC family toxin [Alphaproteobacteria bacterium]|nr:type II toxin-antitoxin system VapC family toxin [Alphaproteobacteria bacterium]